MALANGAIIRNKSIMAAIGLQAHVGVLRWAGVISGNDLTE